MATIISDIESFIKRHRIAPTAFGVMAMNDRHLVRQLRDGRRLWPETEAKVRKFMAEYTPTQSAAA